MRFKAFKIKILILSFVLVALPIGYYGMSKAEAQSIGSLASSLLGGLGGGGETVRVVSDTSESSITTSLQSTLSRIFDAITSGELQSLNLKETVLDPIAWNMAKQLQQQMTGDLLKWLGGQLPGQNGEIPFVQNYSDFYGELLDDVAGDVIFGSDLKGLCSEEQEFQARQAAYNSYVKSRSNQSIFSCNNASSTSNNTDSLLAKMFKNTVNCDGVSVCAGYKAENHLALRQANAVANENRLLDYSRGMKTQRVCKAVTDANGDSRQVCQIVNPAYLAADATSFQLTQIPGLQLLEMDEFNEIVSSLMTRLTNEAVTGISSLANNIDFTGVLGLSGNKNYTNLLFGSDGGLAYVDSLIKDDVSQYQNLGSNPIAKSLETERKNLTLQTFIFNEVKALETKTASNQTQYPNCYNLPLTAELNDALDDAEVSIQIATTSIAILTTLNQQYTTAADASAKNAAMSVYVSYRNQGIFRTDQQNQELEVTFINYTFRIMVDIFKYNMAVEQQRCGGQFDYQGLINSTSTQSNGTTN